jgi:hypothetical protein
MTCEFTTPAQIVLSLELNSVTAIKLSDLALLPTAPSHKCCFSAQIKFFLMALQIFPELIK